LQVEMIDRFGLLPNYLKNLFRLTTLRQRVEILGISRLEAGPSGGKVIFGKRTAVEPTAIVTLVQTFPDIYRLQGGSELKFSIEMFSTEQRFEAVDALVDQLDPKRVSPGQ